MPTSTKLFELPLQRAAARVAGLTALLLLVPLTAMQITDEMAWTPGDFVAAGLLIFGAGMAFVWAARRALTARQRIVAGMVVFLALAVVWAELAVGLFD